MLWLGNLYEGNIGYLDGQFDAVLVFNDKKQFFWVLESLVPRKKEFYIRDTTGGAVCCQEVTAEDKDCLNRRTDKHHHHECSDQAWNVYRDTN